jgi:O-succinylbenzoate synthase
VTSRGVREHRLRIGTRDVLLLEGPAGWGECSPFPGYPCDPAAAYASASEAATVDWPAPRRDQVPVNALVDDGPIVAGSLAGAPAVKIKVGRRSIDEDVARVRAVRDAVGARVPLRVDANGAWDVDGAVAAIGRLAAMDLELVEQPVATIDELAALRRRVDVPLAADECVRTLDDARRIKASGAVDVLVLKVQPLGGVRAALAVAEAAAVPVIVTSMFETSVGLAAGLALACALPELSRACGLDTLDALAGDVTVDSLRPDGWVLRSRPVVPDPELLARYSVIR